MRPLAAVLASLLLALACLACSTSNVKGPQLLTVPPGFGLDFNASAARRVLPDRELVNQRGYGAMRGESFSSVMISEYAGAVSPAEVQQAHDALEERWGTASYEYGVLTETGIDGRTAWWWFERQEHSRQCVAVVAYDDATFSVEFYSSQPGWQDDAKMQEVVRGFSRDPHRYSRILMPLLLVAGLGALGRLAWRLHRSR